MAGCASHYTHYAVFPAENSSGEDRRVRVVWHTAEYPAWWPGADVVATALTVETQCSTRVWRLKGVPQGDSGCASEGVRACGEPGQDRLARTGEPVEPGTVCMAVTNADRLEALEGELALRVDCEPINTQRGSGEEAENRDYVRASAVPYSIAVRKAPRYSLEAGPPELGDAVCDDE
ncbi:hypothetical protein CF392_12145 [Tamilnaduibacter salinus]|nr:hypothetical protein CF392_12145 [Tamilnaduibacter salinus]